MEWEIEDIGHSIERITKQLEPTRQLALKIEDSVVESLRFLKEAQTILVKAKGLANGLVRESERN